MTKSTRWGRWTALLLVAGLALAGCQHASVHRTLVAGPSPAEVQAYCNGAKAPTPTTAEGFRLLMVAMAANEHGNVAVSTPLQVRFSQSSTTFLRATQQELTYLQGQTTTTRRSALDRAFQDARLAMLTTCQSLPASLLTGQPLPLPSLQARLDAYCSIADLPHDTPAQLAALTAAARGVGPFADTPRNKAIESALMVVSFAASHAAFEAGLSPELQRLDASSSAAKQPTQNLPLAIAHLRAACR